MKCSYSLKIGFFISACIGFINGATKSDLCKSDLLDGGTVVQNRRYTKSGSCKQTYISLADTSETKRFCRKRFPESVASFSSNNGKITCEWASLSSCPRDSTYILGNCYRISSMDTIQNSEKICGKFGMNLAYVTGSDVAYWIATLFHEKISHLWIKNTLMEDNPLILRAIDPISGEEVVVSDGASYKSGADVVKTENLVISTRHDAIYGIWQLGAFVKADPAAKLPALCAVAAVSNDPKVRNPLLPYGSMSHNLYTFTSDQISSKELTTVDSSSIHEHCLAQTGKVCSVPKTSSGSDTEYWISVELKRSIRKDYDTCDPAYDRKQEYLLYNYASPRKTVGVLLSLFAANEPKPMCSDFPRVAVQADTSGFMAVPPIIRRPLLPGPDALLDVERLSCDCVSNPPSTVCDPKTRICKCAKPYRPAKDERYIEGYYCVAPPTTTADPCGVCKQHSRCIRDSTGIRCECEKGYEDSERPGEAKNGVCRKKCKCGTGATCTDDEGTCTCAGNTVNVLNDPNRQLSTQERDQYRQSLHCAKECSCTEYAYCKGVTPVCECSSSATDAMDLNPSEYQDLSPPVNGRGQLCLLHTCKEVKAPMQLAIVMDHSGSIDDVSFERQRRFLIALVQELSPEMTTVHFIAFSTGVTLDQTYYRGRWTVNQLVTFMQSLPRLGNDLTGTPEAILRAYQRVTSENIPHKAIFLLTDGEPNCLPAIVTQNMRPFALRSYGLESRCANQFPYFTCDGLGIPFIQQCLNCLLEMGDMIRHEGIKLFGVVVGMGSRRGNRLPHATLFYQFSLFVGGAHNLQEIDDFQQLEDKAKQILRTAFRRICRYERVNP